MSRHGYTDDCDDNLAYGRWRAMVASATRGKRGQSFLRELAAALDAMPDKYLADESLRNEEGEVCAIGCVLKARGMTDEEIAKIDPNESDVVASVAGIAECLAREIMYENDECVTRWDGKDNNGFERWKRVRAWVAKQLKEPVVIQPMLREETND